jgi:Xaa-Pro aminopeptidase
MAEQQLEKGRFILIKERTGGAIPQMSEWIGKADARVGMEFEKITIAQQKVFEKGWDFTYEPVDDFMHELRSVKAEQEIESMRKGAKITMDIFDHMCSVIREGVTEFELLAEMHYMMNRNGCHPSFAPIIASGENSSKPHAVPTDRKLRKGDLITMDFGVIYEGRCTDFTRTVALGEIEEELKLIYNIVKKANIETEAQMREGLSAKEADGIARKIIADAGYGAFYEHGTGHGVGVEIHEMPWLSTKSVDTLKENMIVTCEPGIYLPGKGGVRIEDMLIVKKDKVVNFYDTTKELIIIE